MFEEVYILIGRVEQLTEVIVLTLSLPGNTSDAGILPRALDVLFNSISGQQWEPMNLKPKLFVGVQKLNAEGELRERKIKEKVLRMSQEDVSRIVTAASISFVIMSLTNHLNYQT